jgi:hypothetical protein
MPTSRRQQIVTAIATAMATINVAGGFQTDIGSKVTQWDLTPLTNLTSRGLDVSDPKDEIHPGVTLHQDHDLTIEIRLYAHEGSPPATAAYLRNAIADIYRKIGVDRTWGSLARTTEPVRDEIYLEQSNEVVGGAKVTLTVKYRTSTFNPFS